MSSIKIIVYTPNNFSSYAKNSIVRKIHHCDKINVTTDSKISGKSLFLSLYPFSLSTPFAKSNGELGRGQRAILSSFPSSIPCDGDSGRWSMFMQPIGGMSVCSNRVSWRPFEPESFQIERRLSEERLESRDPWCGPVEMPGG